MILIWIFRILLALILWSFLERKLLKITQYSITAGNLKKVPEDYKLVLLADLHNNTFGKRNIGLIKQIDRMKPDAVIVAGDLITKQQHSIPGHAYDLLEELVQRYPVYYGFGNHELRLSLPPDSEEKLSEQDKEKYRSFQEFMKVLSDRGVHFLVNDTVELTKDNVRIQITGLNIGGEGYSKKEVFPMDQAYLEQHIGKSHPKEYQILIAHNPIFFEQYAAWGADLVLAGHLHGGLVRLPHFGGIISPQYKFFPKYDSGVFKKNNCNMVVSKGLGSHSVMLRLFNRPELVVVSIRKK